jgi:Icc-related predicted phosphoesterase
MSKTRVFFCTDIHGSNICFRKFLGAAQFYNANTIICSGDLTGKLMVPIVQRTDRSYVVRWPIEKEIKNSKELEEVETLVSNSGYYPYRTNSEEVRELMADKDKENAVINHLMIERVKQWCDLADGFLKDKTTKCYLSPGNDDIQEIDPILNEAHFVLNPEAKVTDIDGIREMITLGYSNPTPWDLPRDTTEEQLGNKIEALMSQVKDPKNILLNVHVPPYNSGLDTAPDLDETLKPKMYDGNALTKPVGSTAVRAAIEKYQPLMGLHGHIHEIKAAVKIGRTVCINGGSEYGEGILRGAIIDFDDRGLRSYQFVAG